MKKIICFASLVIALAWSIQARAGGPPPVYLLIDKVVFEPTEEKPARIQIWGTFSLREGDSYGPPQRGYLYYAAPGGAEEKCRTEWAVLKKMANNKQLISFGICGEPNVRAHLRKPSDKVASPIPYPHGKGGFAPGENAERNFPALKKLLVSAATRVVRADLTKIDRRIASEPVYRSRSPKYCLLVFGSKAQTRVWLVLDRDTLYVDRNGNGNLTEEDERVGSDGKEFQAGEITELDGEANVANLRLRVDKEQGTCAVFVEVRDKYRQYGSAPFGDRPQDAPLLHFDGPLTMGLSNPAKQTLSRGDGNQINAWIGTPSVGKAKGATVFLDHSKGVPSNIHPVASIEFPNNDLNGKPIKITAILNQRC
jgi:hypothetical protein